MKLIIEKESDVNDAQMLINWLDIALKQVGGRNGGAAAYSYFENIIAQAVTEYRKANPTPTIEQPN
jgi:hypothetical protein